MKSTVNKNQVLCLALKLFQTVNQDMCKVSEDSFSRVFAVLMVLIQSGVKARKLVLGDAYSYMLMKILLHIRG